MTETIFYVLIFMIGTLFGSFSTLAVYRIPLHKDITHERSFCPNCENKLNFWDMIPVLSYIFLGGKCRYCGEKIRIRYLLLEILTGIIFVTFAISLNIDFYQLSISKFAYLIAGLLYFAGLIIIAGIDKENQKISKGVLIYLTIINIIYMIYLYILEHANIHRYVIYLFVLLLFFIFDILYLKKKKIDRYPFDIISLALIISMFSHSYIFEMTVITTLIIIAIEGILRKIFRKQDGYFKNIKMGYYLAISNILCILIINILAFRWFVI